ncbi:MAG: Crp/Fnr family transcriptional regulator, partial [Cytophagales bacterium]|nr:Crp/Fnr family transcriptional regulator [Cytophagales bacterium]
DMESLQNRTPSHCTIEAIEDSEVLWIQGDTIDVWKEATREELIMQIGLLTRNIITANKRTRLLLSATAEQRYLDFIETYPTLTQRLPLKLIAAYVGITPEYLSEVRRKVAGK